MIRRSSLRMTGLPASVANLLITTAQWPLRLLAQRRFRRELEHRPWRIVIGAGGQSPPGWIDTERYFLDLLNAAHWERCFPEASIDAILAESVWEYLTPSEALTAAKTCFHYLKTGGYVRASVPDGLHPDSAYIEWVRPGGGVDHTFGVPSQTLYTYRTFAGAFADAGFRVHLQEYFDEKGVFHHLPWNPEKGMITRSIRFDPRNGKGRPQFTQIIIDAFKESPNAPA